MNLAGYRNVWKDDATCNIDKMINDEFSLMKVDDTELNTFLMWFTYWVFLTIIYRIVHIF